MEWIIGKSGRKAESEFEPRTIGQPVDVQFPIFVRLDFYRAEGRRLSNSLVECRLNPPRVAGSTPANPTLYLARQNFSTCAR
jgi:hypothetical protein